MGHDQGLQFWQKLEGCTLQPGCRVRQGWCSKPRWTPELSLVVISGPQQIGPGAPEGRERAPKHRIVCDDVRDQVQRCSAVQCRLLCSLRAERFLTVFRSGDDDDKTRDKEALIWTGSSVPVPGCESRWRKMGLFRSTMGTHHQAAGQSSSRAAGKCSRPSWKRGGVTESSSHSLTESRNHPMAGCGTPSTRQSAWTALTLGGSGRGVAIPGFPSENQAVWLFGCLALSRSPLSRHG